MEGMKRVSGVSAPPTPGDLDTSYPPEVAKVVRKLCEDFKICDLNGFAAWYVKTRARWDEIVARSNNHPPGVVIISDAEIAERAREARKEDVRCFPVEYLFNKNIMEKRTCIWRQGFHLWWSEKSSGIMWVGVHGTDSICVVTKKGDLDRGRLIGRYFKIATVEEVLALFRKSILCEIEDLADPPSTQLRQSIHESIKKPFGVVSANPGSNNIYNESGNKASNARYYEEKAIEFLTEKMNRDTDFTVEETIKTAVCAFQCLFPKKLKATEIEVSVVDPMYRVDNPRYGVDPKDENTDRSVWEVPTEEYEKYVNESGRGEIKEQLMIPKRTGLTALETQRGRPRAVSSNIILGYTLE